MSEKEGDIEKQNKALGEQYFVAWNEGDFEAIGEILAPDYQYEMLNHPYTTMNHEGMKGFAMIMRSAFPDLKINIQQIIAKEDIVVIRGLLTGTHEGVYVGVPPTGKKIEFTTIVTFRVEDGKIVEEWELVDMLYFFQQLGIMPQLPK